MIPTGSFGLTWMNSDQFSTHFYRARSNTFLIRFNLESEWFRLKVSYWPELNTWSDSLGLGVSDWIELIFRRFKSSEIQHFFNLTQCGVGIIPIESIRIKNILLYMLCYMYSSRKNVSFHKLNSFVGFKTIPHRKRSCSTKPFWMMVIFFQWAYIKFSKHIYSVKIALSYNFSQIIIYSRSMSILLKKKVLKVWFALDKEFSRLNRQ